MLDRLRLHQSGVPIYVQLREQILQAIGSGALAPGAQLPTMRQVAVGLRIDLNTVQRAYASLERENVLVSVRGRGTFVADAAPAIAPARHEAIARRLAEQTIAQAQSLGLEARDVAREIL